MSLSPSQPLSERRKAILKAIVHEYIAHSHAVASETIARKYALGVSSATVRNEMAALEEIGYITQLHTSAGRVPSAQGYRFYVEHLMEEQALSPDEQHMISHQFHQANLDLDQWLRLAAAVLAQSVQNAAVVTAPRAQQTRFKHLELIQIQENLALLVAVFDGGIIQQQMFVPAQPVAQDELTVVAGRVNRMLEGRVLGTIEDVRGMDGGIEAQALDLVTRMMRAADEQVNANVFVDGIEQILSQPEFALASRSPHGENTALQVVQLIQQGMLFDEMIRQLPDLEGLQIIIGGYGAHAELRQVSLVLSRYGSHAVGGLLGVLGPTRMHYGRAVSVVRYVGGILGEMADQLGGRQ